MFFGIFLVSYQATQSDFSIIISGFGVAFLGYLGLLKVALHSKLPVVPFSYFLILAVVLRIVLIPIFPNLSDDLYRFIWDGYLIHNGINPLSYTPTMIVENNILGQQEFEELLPLLNSPDYFTIYPPISQLVFYVSTIFGLSSYFICAVIIKIILLVAELLSIFALVELLKKIKINKSNLLVYALNPLVIVEIMCNLHFEAIMVAFFLWSLVFLARFKYILSAFLMACSVASKLLPLMFMPAVLLYLYSRQKWKQYLIYFTLFSLVLFIPFFFTLDIPNFLRSIDLYFQKFEFNASVYYLLRALGKYLTGYNQIIFIGPLLALTTLILILRKVYKSELQDLIDLISVCLFAFIAYLFLTTTVHPWYLILPIALSVFNPKWYIIAWSFLITLSYSTYTNPDFNQNYFLICFEYVVVFGLMIYQLIKEYKVSHK